jgi:hypothetical protein
MASIFTGLAFMHGHIVDRELIFRLGREEASADRGAGSRQPALVPRKAEAKAAHDNVPHPACASCAPC